MIARIKLRLKTALHCLAGRKGLQIAADLKESASDDLRQQIDNVDPLMIDFAIAEGKEGIESISTSVDSAQNKVITIVGWMIAALISLSGVLVVQLAAIDKDVRMVIINVYSIFAIGVPAVIMIRGILYKVELYTKGYRPSKLLDKDVIKWINQNCTTSEDKLNSLKSMYLEKIQMMLDADYKIMRQVVNTYRIGVRTLVFTLLFGIFSCLPDLCYLAKLVYRLFLKRLLVPNQE